MKCIKKVFFYSIVFILAMVVSPVLMADKEEFQFGVALMDFDYAEYDDNNVFLDGESGLIPGLVLKLKRNDQSTYTEVVAQFFASTIDYDGQTQGGVPAKTKSDAAIIDLHFKVGIPMSPERNYGPYFGAGYRYWYRNIRSGQDINGIPFAGLLEEYSWYYGLLGYSGIFNVSEKVNMGFDIRLTQMLKAKMKIDFLGFGGLDNAQVNLGEEPGLRFAIPIEVKMKKQTLFVSPYYEIIDIGKSNSVSLTSGGAPTGFIVFEPRSETRNVGIEVTWLW